MNNERDNRPEKENAQPRKFDKFEKLDRKEEETINEVETMGRKKLAVKFFHTSFAIGAIWAIALNLIIETLGRAPTTSIWGGIEFFFENPIVFLYNALII